MLNISFNLSREKYYAFSFFSQKDVENWFSHGKSGIFVTSVPDA